VPELSGAAVKNSKCPSLRRFRAIDSVFLGLRDDKEPAEIVPEPQPLPQKTDGTEGWGKPIGVQMRLQVSSHSLCNEYTHKLLTPAYRICHHDRAYHDISTRWRSDD
jgi:hypothetical protein